MLQSNKHIFRLTDCHKKTLEIGIYLFLSLWVQYVGRKDGARLFVN